MTEKNMLSKSVNFHASSTLPSSIVDGDISSYINMVKNIPHLSADEESKLAELVQNNHDIKAAEKLIKSNLFLVVATAFEYKGYGLPIADIISEGNIGLMKAVKKFDPSRGFRLSTYALWWIRATINEFVLSSWSLVKLGTQSAQKKLFFGLKKLKNKLGIYHDGDMSESEVNTIATTLDVSHEDVREMNARINRDISLNRIVSNSDGENEYSELLVSPLPNSEEIIASAQEKQNKTKLIQTALQTLSERERTIINKRKLTDTPSTLDELSSEFNISQERVRQIESRAMEKLKQTILKETGGFI